jgi:hypothetical protein
VDHQGKHQKVNIRRLAKYYDKDRPFSVNVDGGTQTPSGEPTAGGTPDTGTTDTEWITVRGEPSQSSSDTVPTQRELNQHANPSVRSVAEASRMFWQRYNVERNAPAGEQKEAVHDMLNACRDLRNRTELLELITQNLRAGESVAQRQQSIAQALTGGA